MEDRYITVSQLSKACGIPKKSLYKILSNKQYNTYTCVSNGIMRVSISIIDKLKEENSNTERKEQDKQEQVQTSNADNTIQIEMLKKEIEELKDTIKSKDKQIEEYTIRFAELAGQAQQLASQAQVLHLTEKNIEPAAALEPQEKKGFFRRLFSR